MNDPLEQERVIKALSRPAELLLESMRERGLRPLFRAVTGRATYFTDAMGERDCTQELLELFKAGHVEPIAIDERTGWVTYGPMRAGESDE